MARFITDRNVSKGKAPGSLVLIGRKKMDNPEINLMEYNTDDANEQHDISIQEAVSRIGKSNVTWINIYGIHDLELTSVIGDLFRFHPLLLEDILNTDHRPKFDDGIDYNAFILKMLNYDEEKRIIQSEQITLVLGPDYVLTFQESRGDVFNPVRERIRQKIGRIRLSQSDYLIYSLIDIIVDNYMLIIEAIGSQIEDLEDEIIYDTNRTVVEKIHDHKTELNYLRKTIRPVKEIMQHVLKSENSLFLEKNIQFLKDLNDHIIQAADAIELYGNMLTDQLNTFNSNMSNRMNAVMKVLTIFASIFIPLTFFTGIYGMNFEYLPELKFKYAYPIFWLGVLIIGFGLLFYFRRKKWL